MKGDKKVTAKFEKAGGTHMFYRRRKGSRRKFYLPCWSVPDSAYDDANKIARGLKFKMEASKRAGQ